MANTPTYKFVAPSGTNSLYSWGTDYSNRPEGASWADEFGTIRTNNSTEYNLTSAYTKEDLKKMGLPDRIKPENVRLSADGKQVDIFDDLGNNKWVRVSSAITPEGTLKPLNREFGVDKSNMQAAVPIIALGAALIPGLNAAVGGGLFGLSGTAASVAGGATIGGVTSAVSGGNPIKGALLGGIGGAGSGLANSFSKALGTSDAFSKFLAQLTVGVGKSAVTGQKFNPTSLVAGAIPGVNLGNNFASTLANAVIRNQVTKKIGG